MKPCKTCGVEKPLADYHKAKKAKDGHFNECKDCHRVRQREWARNNTEKHAEMFHRWRRNNLGKSAANTRKYRHMRDDQTPTLAQTSLCQMLIQEMYWFRDFCSEVTGEQHHVDHIIPLSKGGEHAPWNLQVLTATENLSKGAKFGIQV